MKIFGCGLTSRKKEYLHVGIVDYDGRTAWNHCNHCLYFNQVKFFRNMVYQNQLNHRQQLIAMVFFGFFGIMGTYTGFSLSTESLQFDRWTSHLAADQAIATFRVIGVVLGGLLSGNKVGIGALSKWTRRVDVKVHQPPGKPGTEN